MIYTLKKYVDVHSARSILIYPFTEGNEFHKKHYTHTHTKKKKEYFTSFVSSNTVGFFFSCHNNLLFGDNYWFSWGRGNPCSILANIPDCGIIISEFEYQ